MPSGPITRDAFDHVTDEIVGRLADEQWDGVCLDLHGSMYVDGVPDPEGALLERIRETIGHGVPITAALDMHATITERLVTYLDGVAGYRTAPHTDVAETGERAATQLVATVTGEADLALGWERMPMLLAGEQSETDAEPMQSLIDTLRACDERTAIYDANYFLGFPWADTPHAGCHVVVTGDASERDAVVDATMDLATAFWRRRDEIDFTTPAYDLDGALDAAAAAERAPAVIADTGDIPGAGAREDAVDVIAALLDRADGARSVDALVAVVVDPAAVEACRTAGEGQPVNTPLGRIVETGSPIRISGTVSTLHSAEEFDAAVVDLGGVEVVITDRRTNRHRDPDFLRSLGLEPTDRSLVVLKSGYLSPAWKEVAQVRLFALTPGDTDQRLAELPYERVPRPIHPLDDVDWTPARGH